MTSPPRQLRDALEPVAAHAFWSPANREAMSALGLDFVRGYICGRAACLGPTVPAVVVSTFAWFEPSMISTNYLAGMAVTDVETLTREREQASNASLRQILKAEDVTHEADLLTAAVAAGDGTGRPLLAARRALGAPADPVGRLLWAAETLRDFRGDSHIAAALVAAIDPIEMNLLTELSLGIPLRTYTMTRAWPAEAIELAVERLRQRGWVDAESLTPQGRTARDQVESDTDRQLESIIAVIGDALPGLCARLNDFGQLCIAAGAFPDDALKRAAG